MRAYMNLNGEGERIFDTLPGAGFWIASVCGALLLVCGSAAFFFDLRDSKADLPKDLFEFAPIGVVGVGMIVLAFLGERTGPAHRVVVPVVFPFAFLLLVFSR